jgi:uncharacterized protein YukE
MAFKKKSSMYFEHAIKRIASVKAIDPTLDLGNGLTVESYQQSIDQVSKVMEDYNTHLSLADSLRSSLKEKEKLLRTFSERMLTGVAAKFGKDSEQYQKAGGTKKSERRRPKRKIAKVAD